MSWGQRFPLHVLIVAAALSSPSAAPAESTPESLGPQEHVLQDGSRAGSLVYVDSHGDLVRVRYRVGPRGLRLEKVPVKGSTPASPVDRAPPDAQESQVALQLLPPPTEVRRAPTLRPSDAFWQPKEASDVTRKERSDRLRPAGSRVTRVTQLPSGNRTRNAPAPNSF